MPSAKPETIPLWRKYLTVEPAVFLYFYGLLMLFPVEGIYIYQRVSDMKGFPYQNISQGGGGGCGREEESETNSSLWQLEEEAQTLTSNIFLGYNLVLTILSLFVAPLWGPWTDKGGKRKPALQVAILGACLELSITLLVIYLELSVYILFVAAAVSGLSGFATVLLIGASSYIADISSEEERAFRLAILYLQIFFAGVISQMTSGLWIDNIGFIPSAWFILFCFILAGVWTLFCLPETPRSTNGVVPHFFSLENIKSFLNFFRKERQSGRKNIFLPLTCAGVVHLVTIGVAGVLTLFLLKSPLCWGPTLVGYYFAFAMFVHGVGSVAGVNYFGRCFTDLTVFRIGMVTLILSSILLAFSSRTWMIFVAGAVGIFNGVPEPILQSGMSRIVGEDEQGVLFSTYGVITALTQLVGAVLFNSVYQASLSTFKGLVFILCAVLVIIPFVLLSFVELPPAEDSTNEATEAHELEKSDTQNQILNVADESMENEQRNTAV